MTQTRLQQYHNEAETERCTDVATIEVKYIGRNPVLRTPEQVKANKPVPVECYFSNRDDVWYARTPAKKDKAGVTVTPASDWVRANVGNLVGLIEE